MECSREEFLQADCFYHKTLTNKDGSALKARRNGSNKIWKTRPEEFKIPVKLGLYEFGYITQENMKDWKV